MLNRFLFFLALLGCWGATVHADDPAPADRTNPGHARVAEKNLRKIGLAFHNYHDHFSKFPATVTIGGDEKTPHSWRVELLPFLKDVETPGSGRLANINGSHAKYEDAIRACGYEVNKPWDSPENAACLKAMPAVFRHPTDPEDTTESAFYALVGPETALSPEGASITTIPALGSTLMVVESRNREPWTKPVDILYLEEAAMPRLGGYSDYGFLGLTCDGATHLVSKEIKNDALRAFITKRTDDKFEIPGVPWKP